MTREIHERFPLSAAVLTLTLVISGALANAQPNSQPLPNMGQYITTLAPQRSQFVTMNPGLPDRPDLLVEEAVTAVASPDRKTLLVLTSGYNRVYRHGSIMVFTGGYGNWSMVPGPTPANANSQPLPNMGQYITPLAPQDSQFVTMNPDLPDGSDLLVGQAVTTVVSSDHKTLLVETSGYNRVYALGVPAPPYPWYAQDSNDIPTQTTIKKQVVQIPNTYNGTVFDPSGAHRYVASGQRDNVYTITLSVL